MRRWGGALALLVVIAGAAGAQTPNIHFGLQRADALLVSGQLAAAESEYYAAVNARPRDPIARAALGRYLAARGALKVGVVLLEEARQFGGDPAVIARDLAPLYAQLGDYTSLARLPQSPLTLQERARVEMLAARATTVRMDATARVAWQSPDDAAPLGRVGLSISGHAVDATIDPTADDVAIGGMLGTDLRGRGVRSSGPSRDDWNMGVFDSIGFGGVMWSNVPMRRRPLPRTAAVIGLGWLLRYSPTFDPRARTITLHSTGAIRIDATAIRYPALFMPQGPLVLVGGRWMPLVSPEVRALTAGRRFSIDFRRGMIEVGR